MTITGDVVNFWPWRGYGFIKDGNGREYFVHVSSIMGDGFKILEPNQKVEFRAVHLRKGWQAYDVKIIRSMEPTLLESEDKQNEKITFKRNPFNPQSPITNPKKFGGRKQILQNAVEALFNNNNILVTGERGIGKSSTSYQLLYMTRGEQEMLQRLGIDPDSTQFNCLTGDFICTPSSTLTDIVNGLVKTVYYAIGKDSEETGTTKEIGFDLKILKGKISSTSAPQNIDDLSISMAFSLDKLFQNNPKNCDGITLLIDEVDLLNDASAFAPFLKATCEKVALNKRLSLKFIVSGVTGTNINLVVQHESSARLFQTIELKRMPSEELMEIIYLTLYDTDTKMTQNAKKYLIEMSNEYPHPLQLIGYHAFKYSKEGKITKDDIYRSVQYIVETGKYRDYENMFYKIGRGDETEIIRTFSAAPLPTVNRNYLLNTLSHMSEQKIFGAIGQLLKLGILEKQDRDVYRFKDTLFRVYIERKFGIRQN